MRWTRGWLSRAAVVLISVWAAGCSSDIAADSPLQNARRSPEALAEAALAALAERDEEALSALMITREEYETLLWPSMPDRDHMPFAFVWSVTGPRSRKARREALDRFGGLPMELVRVEFEGDVERYETFALHRDGRMTVRRLDTGEEGSLPLMDVLVEMHELQTHGTDQLLAERFGSTHRMRRIDAALHAWPPPPVLADMDELDKLLAVWEWRIEPTPWAVLERRPPVQ